MSIKIIASDLDGTLMSPDHMTITERTKNALLFAHNMGVRLAIVTGRPLALIGNVINQIPFTDYVITANGASVYDMKSREYICSDFICNDTARRIISYFLKQRVFFEVYIDGRSQYEFGYEQYLEVTEFPQGFIDEVSASMDGHDDLLEFLGDREIEKITLYSVKDCDYDMFKAELERYGLATATSFKGNLEATNGTADKGSALRGLCEALGFTADEAMSFGDAGNDCPMLELAGCSFAMENGTEPCKKSAKHIAKSNAEDGVAQAIEEYVLNSLGK